MNAVEVRGLRKSYGSFEAVRGIDLTVRTGEVFALLGPNGAGKTTIVEILEGHRQRSSGEVSVLGHDPGRNERALKERVGIVLQQTGVDEYLTVREVVEMVAGYYPAPRDVDEVIALVGLTEQRDQWVKKLSGGQKRRVDLAVALAGDPELLFLDEPTNGMDPKGRDEMLALIHDLGHNKRVNLILSSHLLPDVEHTCDHVIVMDKGRIATQGPIATLKGTGGSVFELRIKGDLPRFVDVLRGQGLEAHGTDEDVMRVLVPAGRSARDVFSLAASQGMQVRHLRPSVPTLEDVFIDAIEGGTHAHS